MLSLSVLGSSKETSEVEDEENILDELENTGMLDPLLLLLGVVVLVAHILT